MAPFSNLSKHHQNHPTKLASQQVLIESLEIRQLMSNTGVSFITPVENLSDASTMDQPAAPAAAAAATAEKAASKSKKPDPEVVAARKLAALQKAIDKFRTHILTEVHNHPKKASDPKFQTHITNEQLAFAARIAKRGGLYTPIDFASLAVGTARPAAPVVTVTVVSANAINISWTSIAGARSYKLETSANNGSTWTTLRAALATTYAHTGLVADTSHKYRVTTTGSTGTSVPSGIATVSTLLNPPTGSKATPFSITRIDLSWTVVTHATSYKIERSTNQTTWTALAPSPALTGTSKAYSDTSALASTLYYYRISAINAAGTSAAATAVHAQTLPAAPVVTAVAASSTVVNLTWPAITGATSYKVETSTDGGNTWATLSSSTTTTYANTALTADTNYKYRVTTINPTGPSAASTVVDATTLLNPPTGSVATTTGATQITLGWAAVTDATSYKLERSTNQTTWTVLTPSPALNGSSISYVDTSVTAGLTYYYRVSAVDAAGTSVPATAVSALTLPIAPALTATVFSATQVNLTWTTIVGATSYKLETSTDGGNVWTTLTSPTTTSYSNTALTADTAYKYRVSTINAAGTSLPSNVASATTILAVPTGLAATAISSTQVNLNWTILADATSYKIERSLNQTTWSALTPSPALTGTSDNYSDTGVIAGTTYYYRLSAINASGTSAASSAVTILTYPTRPTLTATVFSATQINLSWVAITGAASYKVESSTDGGSTWTTLSSPATATYSNTALSADTTYKYRVSTINATGTSAPSEVSTVTTLLTAPATPTATANTPTQITVTWTPLNDATSYKIERSLNQTTWTALVPSPALTGSSSSYADTGLTAGTTYYYRVSAIDAVGTSAASAAGHAQTYPATPTITATVASASVVNLTWTTIASATSYTLETSTDGGSTWSTLSSPAVTTYSNTALTADTTYKYRVSAVNPTGSSVASNVATAITILSSPTGLTATAAGPTQVNLTWTLLPDATGYKIERSLDQTAWTALTISPALTGSSTAYSDTGVNAGTAYHYRISGIDASGTSVASTVAHVLTNTATPTLTATSISTTQINLSWTTTTGATSYLLETSTDSGISWSTLASPTTTTYQNTALTADTTYKYRVSAVNTTGTGVASSVVTASTFLSVPQNFNSTTATATEIDLSWTALAHATGYKVERSINQTTWTALTISPALTGTSSAYADTTASAGTVYYYRLSAINAVGTSAATTAVHSMTVPAAPVVTASVASATQINLSWVTIASATGYNIDVSTDAGTTWSVAGSATGTTFADTNLTPDTAYKLRVSAVNAGGSSVPTVTASLTTLPAAPTGFTATDNSATVIDLAWTAVTHATSYKIERSLDNSVWTVLVPSPALTGTSSTFSDTALQAGTNYNYRISTIDTVGTSAASTVAHALTLPAVPTLTGTPISATQINLSWTAVTGAASYTLETSTDSGTTWTTLASPTTTTYANTALTTDTSYQYRVSAVNATGTSAASSVSTVSTLLLAPSGITVTTVSNTELDLAWTAVTDATNYKIERSLNQTAWTTLVPSPALTGTSSTYADTALTPGAVYYYRLSTIGTAGTSAPAAVAHAQTLPSTPTLVGTVISATQINLRWNAVFAAVSYTLESSPDSGTTWTTISSPTGTTYNNTALTADTAYQYRIATNAATGASNTSSPITVTTLLAAPAGLAATSASSTEIDLAWTASTDATNYKIERSLDQATWTTLSPSPALNGTSSTYADTSLATGTTYYYRISGIDAAGTSVASTAVHAITFTSTPTLTGTVVSATQINLSWTSVRSAVSYTLETSADSGTTWTTLSSPTGTTYSNTALTADTAYQYRVSGVNAGGTSVASSVATVTTLLAAPTGFGVTAASATEIDLAWTAVTDATNYKIERSLDNAIWSTVTASPALTGTSSTYADTVLAGTTYYYRLSAIDAAGTSAPCTAAHTLSNPPTPTLTGTVVSATQINLSWTAVKSAVSYTLETSADSGTTWTTLASPTGTTYSNTALTADTAYQYRVSGVNGTGPSVASSVATVTTLLAAPAGFGLTSASGTEIDLAWTASTDATNYKIERSLTGATWSTVTVSPALTGTSSTYADTALTSGTTYYYRLSAIDAAGTSAPTTAAHTMTLSPTPTLTASVFSATQINLVWGSSRGAASYLLETSVDSGTTWTTLASPTTTTYSNTALTADTSYQYRVSAVNAGGTSTASNVATVSTLLLAPAGFGSTTASSTELDLAWTAVTDATNYKIERSRDNTVWTTLTPSPALTGTSSTYADTGLAAGTTFYYRISAIDAAGTSATATAVHSLTAPATPTLSASVVSATRINLTWTPSLSATSYLLETSVDAGTTWTTLASPTTTSYANTALTADTSYQYRVSSINAGGTSAPSSVATRTTLLLPPSDMTATSATATEVDLAWTAITDATNYKIERSENQVLWTTLVPSPALTGTSSTFNDTTAAAGTTYYYRISGISASGTSAPATAVTILTIPDAPVVTATVGSSTEIDLTWNDVESATSYLVETSTDGGTTWTTLAHPTEADYSNTGLTADTAYKYRVSATNATGTSAASTVSTITTLLDFPAGFAATSASATSVTLAWTASTDATSYVIERSDDNNDWTPLVPSPALTGTSTTFTDTALTAGTAYSYRLSAVNAAGTSAPTATSIAVTRLVAPVGLTATAASATQINLAWTADTDTGLLSYKIQGSSDGTTWADLISVATSSTSIADVRLTTGTTYYYRLIAVNAGGDSAPGTAVHTTTL